MEDQQLWDLGIVRLNSLLKGLSAETGLVLLPLLARYREIKEACATVIAEIDAASVCCDCQGLCCLNGKYRVNVLDALARVAAGVPTSVDFSQKPICPYGGKDGCAMEPGLRPADCVLFLCDRLDRLLTPDAKEAFIVLEQELRECMHHASVVIGEKMTTPLLLWVDHTNKTM